MEDNKGYGVLAIVAIVAIIGLVVMFSGKSSTFSQPVVRESFEAGEIEVDANSEQEAKDISGQAYCRRICIMVPCYNITLRNFTGNYSGCNKCYYRCS